MKKKKMSVHNMVILALFAALSTVLMYLETPLPLLPPFLKLDVSALPVVLASFTIGPIQSIFVVLIKDLVHLLSTQTGGVGELADFIMVSSFALVAGFTYRGLKKTTKGAIIGCVLGTIAMMSAGVAANYLLLIPFYSKLMPIEAIVSACNAINSNVTDMSGYYLLGVLPFNFVKGVLVSLVTLPTFHKLGAVLKVENLQ